MVKNRVIKRILRCAIAVLVTLCILCGACLLFLMDSNPADWEAIDAFSATNAITSQEAGSYLVFAPDDATVGFIFYPGARVEYEAYIPLMEACAAEGVLCVLVDMPLNFPLICGDAAEGVPEMYRRSSVGTSEDILWEDTQPPITWLSTQMSTRGWFC